MLWPKENLGMGYTLHLVDEPHSQLLLRKRLTSDVKNKRLENILCVAHITFFSPLKETSH